MTNATHDCTGCPVSAGTYKPADAVHTEIAEPAAYPEMDAAQFSGNGPLWALIYEWSNEDCDVNGRKIDEHIQSMMRAYVDADRALRAEAPRATIDPLIAECRAIAATDRVAALKRYRERTGCSLVMARDALFPNEAAPQAALAAVPTHYVGALPPHAVITAAEHHAEVEHANGLGLGHLVARRTPLYSAPAHPAEGVSVQMREALEEARCALVDVVKAIQLPSAAMLFRKEVQALASVNAALAATPAAPAWCVHCGTMANGLCQSKCPNRTCPQGHAAAGVPAAAPDALTQAARDVLAERARQISTEGWTPANDDGYVGGALSDAAGCYAMQAYGGKQLPEFWPWTAAWWKPSENPRRNLEKAGALILAEIERIDRAAIAAQAGKGVQHGAQ